MALHRGASAIFLALLISAAAAAGNKCSSVLEPAGPSYPYAPSAANRAGPAYPYAPGTVAAPATGVWGWWQSLFGSAPTHHPEPASPAYPYAPGSGNQPGPAFPYAPGAANRAGPAFPYAPGSVAAPAISVWGAFKKMFGSNLKMPSYPGGPNFPNFPGGPNTPNEPPEDDPEQGGKHDKPAFPYAPGAANRAGPAFPYAPGAANRAGPAFPYAPTTVDAPAVELSIISGAVVALHSHVLQAFCNVAPATAALPFALQCDEATASSGVVIEGLDFTTTKLVDGSLVLLKAQRSGMLCALGSPEEGGAVTCGTARPSAATIFVLRKALARDDLYYLTPSGLPGSKCHPAHVATDHGLADVPHLPGDYLAAHHVMVCDGAADGDNALLSLTVLQPPPQSVWSWLKAVMSGGCTGSSTSASSSDAASDAAAAADDKKPSGGENLPVTNGGSGTLSDPGLAEESGVTCDTDAPDKPYLTTAAALRRALTSLGDDEDDLVTCDHAPLDPSSPGAEWKLPGFKVQGKNQWGTPVKSGEEVDLSSMATGNFCSPSEDHDDVMMCNVATPNFDTKYTIVKDVTSPPGSDGIEVFILHVATQKYCGAATSRPRSPMKCAYEFDDKPTVLFKVNKPPWGPGK